MHDRLRKQAIIGSALRMDVNTLLYAFDLAYPHVHKGGTYKSRLAEQESIALALVDWAICESDRGDQLLQAKSEGGYVSRGDGQITVTGK